MMSLLIGNPVVAYHNHELGKAITSLNTRETTLNAVVPFEWDLVYTFAPYTSQSEIEELIGFRSGSIRMAVNEGMVQLLFVKGDRVVASICGYDSSLGYDVNFTDSVIYDENTIFAVSRDSGITILTVRQ